MPELPEVETVRQTLLVSIIDKPITHIDVRFAPYVRDESALRSLLLGQSIVSIERKGKLLIFFVHESEQCFIVHLKMTGQIIYKRSFSSSKDSQEMLGGGHSFSQVNFNLPHKHTHVVLTFADGSQLFFNDMRKFGYIHVVHMVDLKDIHRVGIEPLTSNFTWENFFPLFAGRKTNLKAFLLNQKNIAGLGNIYVDESCFAAHLRPDRIVSDLNVSEIRALFDVIPPILQKAIDEGGATFSNYTDGHGRGGNYKQYLEVFHKEGTVCSRCKQARIVKIRLAGRGTHFCPNCQH